MSKSVKRHSHYTYVCIWYIVLYCTVYCRTGRIGYMGAYILMIMDGWLIEYFISSSRRKSTGQYSSDTRSTNRI